MCVGWYSSYSLQFQCFHSLHCIGFLSWFYIMVFLPKPCHIYFCGSNPYQREITHPHTYSFNGWQQQQIESFYYQLHMCDDEWVLISLCTCSYILTYSINVNGHHFNGQYTNLANNTIQERGREEPTEIRFHIQFYLYFASTS